MKPKKTKRLYARIKGGRILCPKCGAMLGKAYYDAKCEGIELWCKGSKCHLPIELKIE